MTPVEALGIGAALAVTLLLLTHAADVIGNRVWPPASRHGGAA